MKKVLLPEDFGDTIIGLLEKEGFIHRNTDSIEAKAFIRDVKEQDPNFDEDRYWNFVYHRKKRNKHREQQFFQMLFLNDSVLFSNTDIDLNYDFTELKKIDGITFLDEETLNKVLYPSYSHNLDYSFSQYIKPAVISNLKKDIKHFYKIRDKSISEHLFASILYDMTFSSKENLINIINKYPTFEKVWHQNKVEYELYRVVNYPDAPTVKGEYDAVMFWFVLQSIKPIISEYELSRKLETTILNPTYTVEKLGTKTEQITEISDVYGTLKLECSKVIDLLPEFHSIRETLDFKEKHEIDVRRLKTVIGELMETLQNCGKRKMIEKAGEDVNKAVREINRGKKLTKVDRWTTFIALPASILEYYCSMPPIISIPLGIYGISSYFSKRYIDLKNNWIRIIR